MLFTGSVSADDGECCYQKTVGSDSYTLLSNPSAVPPECSNTCAYQRDGLPGSQFCFKPGNLPVKCIFWVFKLINKYGGSTSFSGNITFAYDGEDSETIPYSVGPVGPDATFEFPIPAEATVQSITAEDTSGLLLAETCVSFTGPTFGRSFEIFYFPDPKGCKVFLI